MTDIKAIYQKISEQNGSTFAQMLRKYDENILNMPALDDLLQYAGKDLVGTLFFLDTLKENKDAFKNQGFCGHEAVYFDDDLIEIFIKKAHEIRKMEGGYPKSSVVAQNILKEYMDIRRKKLAIEKDVLPQDIKNNEIFAATERERALNWDVEFIKEGNPSYLVGYLLNTMISNEIEFLKKKGKGISARNLNLEEVRGELSASLAKFMGKYHYENGKLYRFNLEVNGVYFMDNAMLKAGEIVPINPEKYFQIDGLIVDIKTGKILNPAGVDAKKVEVLREKIKNKSLSVKEEKNIRILCANEKEVALVKEGKSMSVFEQVCRLKGRAFAEALREADSRIFDVPKLTEVIRYADKENPEFLIFYLQSLKEKLETNIKSDVNSLTHLFMAGYVPCYTRELTEKYIELVNKLVPVKVDEEGKNDVSIPKELAIQLAKNYAQDKKSLLAKERGCLAEEISDLDVLTVTSETEKNMIASYYAPGEAICTLRDPDRHESNFMINAVKRNVNDLKRENFKNPRREDEYGTSVISIQISKSHNGISIKNRYNHTLQEENPDNTFNSNPDYISPGMVSALKSDLNTSFETTQVEVPYHHVAYDGACLFNYDYELNGVYFSKNHYLKNYKVHDLKDCHRLRYGYLTPQGEILLTSLGNGAEEFKTVMEEELKNKQIRYEKDETTGFSYLYADNELVAKFKDNEVVALHLVETMELPYSFLKDAPLLEELTGKNVICVANEVLMKAPRLQKVDLPNCVCVPSYFLKNSTNIEINMPSVFENNKLKSDYERLYSSLDVSNLAQWVPEEFKNKSVSLKIVDGWKTILANGEPVARLTNEGRIYGLYLNNSKKFPPLSFYGIEEIVAPYVETIDRYPSFFDSENLKRVELPNCYYIASKKGKVQHKDCVINAPYIYNDAEGVLSGCLLKKLSPKLTFPTEIGIFFNKYFKDKKVSFEKEGQFSYLCVDGQRVVTCDLERDQITHLKLTGLEDFDLKLLCDRSFALKELSLPDTKRILPEKEPLPNLELNNLQKLHVPNAESLGVNGFFLLEHVELNPDDYNKEKLEKNGVYFFNNMVFNANLKRFVSQKYHLKTFCSMVNKNIELGAGFDGVSGGLTVSKTDDGVFKLFLNNKLMAELEDGCFKKLNLEYIQKMEPSTIGYLRDLVELKMDNLQEMGSGNMNYISVEKMHFPKLKNIGDDCFNSFNGKEISLPEVKTIGKASFCGEGEGKKVLLPNLAEADLSTCFSDQGVFSGMEIETNYFKDNQCVVFGEVIVNLHQNKIIVPSRDTHNKFEKMLAQETDSCKLRIEEKDGIAFLYSDERPLMRLENGKITGLYLEKAQTINLNVPLKGLKEVVAKNATKIEQTSSYLSALERLEANHVEEMSDNCLNRMINLKEISLPNLKKMGDNCCVDLKKTLVLKFNQLKECGKGCFVNMPLLKEFSAIYLEKAGEGSFEQTPQLKHMNTPFLQNRLALLKDHPEKRRLLKSMRKRPFFSHINHAGFLAK